MRGFRANRAKCRISLFSTNNAPTGSRGTQCSPYFRLFLAKQPLRFFRVGRLVLPRLFAETVSGATAISRRVLARDFSGPAAGRLAAAGGAARARPALSAVM